MDKNISGGVNKIINMENEGSDRRLVTTCSCVSNMLARH